MKTKLLELLICPSCLPLEVKLDAHLDEQKADDIQKGVLQCSACSAQYPIDEGIAFLTPNYNAHESKHRIYESDRLVSSYLWSHFGEFIGDEDANTAYGGWSELIPDGEGIAMDAGCAVGRFTFEMGASCGFAVGVDLSTAFIRSARKLMKDRHLDMLLPMEGMLIKKETVYLPEKWSSDQVEFVVADIQALPFHSEIFGQLSSLNLVDKVPFPQVHLREMNRVARKKDAQFLFSDPFSWSKEVARPEEWLGGTDEGPFAGRGPDNVAALLSGKIGDMNPVWNIEKQGHVWWKIRTHENHFELIRSQYLKAIR